MLSAPEGVSVAVPVRAFRREKPLRAVVWAWEEIGAWEGEGGGTRGERVEKRGTAGFPVPYAVEEVCWTTGLERPVNAGEGGGANVGEGIDYTDKPGLERTTAARVKGSNVDASNL
jgi:hypothetical protein